MKRLLWLGVGLAVGGLVVRAVSRKARAYTPAGMAASARETAGGLVDSVRSFVDDVRDSMAERERQIQAALADGMSIEDLVQGSDDGLDQASGGRLDGRSGDRSGRRSGGRHRNLDNLDERFGGHVNEHFDQHYRQEGTR